MLRHSKKPHNSVTTFAGKKHVLSNFYPCDVKVFDFIHKLSEHAFVMLTPSRLEKIRLLRGYCKLDLHSKQRLKPLHTGQHEKKRKKM